MTTHISPCANTDLVAVLLAEQSDAPVTVGSPARHVLLPPSNEMEQTGRAILEATIALFTGNVHHMACGGTHGELWRVEWHAGFDSTATRHVGVLEPNTKKFFTSAPFPEAVRGFAIAAHGLAFARPHTQFDGAWATLLATFAVEGEAALTAANLARVRRAVMQALEVEGTTDTSIPTSAEDDGPRWSLEHLTDAFVLPGLANEPESLQRGRRHARVDRLITVFSDLCAFATVSADWQRTMEPFKRGGFVGPQVHDTLVALHAGQHVVLIGPPGEGKTVCAEQAVAVLADKGVTSGTVMSIPLGFFDTPARLMGCERFEGPFETGPLHAALTANDGAGSVLHVTCDQDISPALVPLVRELVTKRVLPPELTSGMPMTPIGDRFRLIVEVSRWDGADLPPNLAAAIEGHGGVSIIPFANPDERQTHLLLHDVAGMNQTAMTFLISHVVADVRRAAQAGTVARGLSSSEVLAWAHVTTMMRIHGAASDLTALLERTALTGWVRALAGAEAWWHTRHPLSMAEAALRHRVAQHSLPASPIDWFPGQAGSSTWYRHEELRRAIDEITAVVHPDVPLALLAARATPAEGSRIVAPVGSGDAGCQVWLDQDGSPVDAFIQVVTEAARARGRARWTAPLGAPLDEVLRIADAFRIDRLLDGIADARLQRYRRRAAEAVATRHGNRQLAGGTSCIASAPIEGLAQMLEYLSAQYTLAVPVDAADPALVAMASTIGARRGDIDVVLHAAQSIACAPLELDVLSDAAQLLARRVGQLVRQPDY